jgi:hypothetical protein
MQVFDQHVNVRLDRACRATDKFIRDYSERMKYPVSQLYSIVGDVGNERIDQKDLDTLNRIIKDINILLTELMEDLEREGNPEECRA